MTGDIVYETNLYVIMNKMVRNHEQFFVHKAYVQTIYKQIT